MNRKLLLLDAVLVAVVAWAGIQLRNEWRASKAREAAMLSRRPKPVQAPGYTPPPGVPPVMPSGYINIADKMLFDKSRNSTVVIETPPPPPKPPMPPLPVYHGVMNIGPDGPMAILSVNANAPHQAVHPGETIGQFRLVDVNSVEMTLEWNGETVRKPVEEFSGRNAPPQAQAAAAARTETPGPPVAAEPPKPAKSGPGEATIFGFKTCDMKDGNAEGAVVEGYKKVIHTTPFGQSCTWELVSQR